MRSIKEILINFKFELLMIFSLFSTIMLINMGVPLLLSTGNFSSGIPASNMGGESDWFMPLFLILSVCILLISSFMVLGKYIDKILTLIQTRNHPKSEIKPNIFLNSSLQGKEDS